MQLAEIPVKRDFLNGIISTTINRYSYSHGNSNKTFEHSTPVTMLGIYNIEKGAAEIKNESLKRIFDLEYNWNGNHASKFEISLLTKAQSILDSLSVIPDIFPTARKSIQFEYEKENGAYLEFEIFENRVDYLLIKSDGQEFEATIVEKDISELVKRFHDQSY